MHLNEYIDKFCEYSLFVRRNSAKSVTNYRLFLSHFVKFLDNHFIAPDIKALNIETIESYISSLSRRDFATWTVIHHRLALNRLCVFLQSKGILDSNPVEKIPKPKLEKRLPEFLTGSQATAMLSAIRNTKHKLIIATILFTGVRIAELSKLMIEDININENCIRARSKGRERMIYFPDNFKNMLTIYLNGRTTGSLFELSRDGMQTLFARLKRNGIIPVSAHKLRHTYATLMIQGGADLRSVQEMMGHSDIKTTSIYLHCVSDQLKKASMLHPLA
jgi:site-specific recombinase XerD